MAKLLASGVYHRLHRFDRVGIEGVRTISLLTDAKVSANYGAHRSNVALNFALGLYRVSSVMANAGQYEDIRFSSKIMPRIGAAGDPLLARFSVQ